MLVPLGAPQASATLVSITEFGAVDDGVTDNRAAIQAAFDAAATRRSEVLIPKGRFAYSGMLRAAGIAIRGTGTQSVLAALDGENEALELSGDHARLHRIRMLGTGTSRLTTPNSGMIWVHSAREFTIEAVEISGSSSVGIMVDGSAGGLILDNSIERTLADAIHIVNGSRDVVVKGNRVSKSGDDGIAVVSYRGQPIAGRISIESNAVEDNLWGRGIAVVGGHEISILTNRIEGGPSDYAGIYIAAERQWRTVGVRSVRVSGNRLKNTGGYRSGHGAITIYNSYDGEVVNEDINVVDNLIEMPRSVAVLVTGSGSQKIVLERNRACAIPGRPLLRNDGRRSAVSAAGNTMRASGECGPE